MDLTLTDLEWGDVITDANGVLVTRATAPDGTPVVVKRFARPEFRREIRAYALLAGAGVPTLPVLGAAEDHLIIADVSAADLRLGTESDLGDTDVARWVAEWYAALHSADVERGGLYSENDLLTDANLREVAERWPELAGAVEKVRAELPGWLSELAELPEVVTYNDFWWTNLAVADFGGSALMFDYNLLGRGYRYADLRNVTHALGPAAAEAFLARYEELTTPVADAERDLDERLAPLVALVIAARAPEMPGWAQESYDWLAARA